MWATEEKKVLLYARLRVWIVTVPIVVKERIRPHLELARSACFCLRKGRLFLQPLKDFLRADWFIFILNTRQEKLNLYLCKLMASVRAWP